MQIAQKQVQTPAVMPQTIQCRQLLQFSLPALEAFLSKVVLDNPYLEPLYEREDCVSFDTAPPPDDEVLSFAGDGENDRAEHLPICDEICGGQGLSLRDALCFQADLLELSPADRSLLYSMIEWLEPTGYFSESLTVFSAWAGCSGEKAESLLKLLQTLSPPGVGARTPQECLLLQLPPDMPDLELASRLIQESLPLLARGRYDTLRKQYGVSEERLREVCRLICSLNPKPGTAYCADSAASYQYPDARVRVSGNQLEVTVGGHPRWLLRYDRGYMRNVTDKEAADFLQSKKNEAVRLLNSLDMRYNVLCRLLDYVALRQRGFFLAGPSHLNPLTMREAAAAIGVHPSTVSRCVSGKYVETPWGVYALRHFFPAVSIGDELTKETAKLLIARIIREEDKRAPVSDQELAERLAASGMHVSRRTVSKYREQLGIENQRQRRRS